MVTGVVSARAAAAARAVSDVRGLFFQVTGVVSARAAAGRARRGGGFSGDGAVSARAAAGRFVKL